MSDNVNDDFYFLKASCGCTPTKLFFSSASDLAKRARFAFSRYFSARIFSRDYLVSFSLFFLGSNCRLSAILSSYLSSSPYILA